MFYRPKITKIRVWRIKEEGGKEEPIDVDLNLDTNKRCGAIIWDDNLIEGMLKSYYDNINSDTDPNNNAYHHDETKTRLIQCGGDDDGNFLIKSSDVTKLWHCNHNGNGRPTFMRKLGKSPLLPHGLQAVSSHARALRHSLANAGNADLLDIITTKELKTLINSCDDCDQESFGSDSFLLN